MINSLSIDWEDWYQVPLARISLSDWDRCKPAIEPATEAILSFLSKHRLKATFFVSGYCAERHPDLVQDIAASGHEVESHGYWHELAYNQSDERFQMDISKSVQIIRSITGRSPTGYRSPAWSTTRTVERATRVLVEAGFRYDSSFFPTRNFLFGGDNFSSATTYTIGDTNLLEIPPSTLNAGIARIPVTGGWYMRGLPYAIFRRLVQLRNRTGPAMIYFHPWEIIADYPRMEMPLVHRVVQYYRCGRLMPMLERLVSEFRFGSFRQVYPQIDAASRQTVASTRQHE